MVDNNWVAGLVASDSFQLCISWSPSSPLFSTSIQFLGHFISEVIWLSDLDGFGVLKHDVRDVEHVGESSPQLSWILLRLSRISPPVLRIRGCWDKYLSEVGDTYGRSLRFHSRLPLVAESKEYSKRQYGSTKLVEPDGWFSVVSVDVHFSSLLNWELVSRRLIVGVMIAVVWLSSSGFPNVDKHSGLDSLFQLLLLPSEKILDTLDAPKITNVGSWMLFDNI